MKCCCNSNSAQYERNRRFRQLAFGLAWKGNGPKLPSVGLWLNASKSESVQEWNDNYLQTILGEGSLPRISLFSTPESYLWYFSRYYLHLRVTCFGVMLSIGSSFLFISIAFMFVSNLEPIGSPSWNKDANYHFFLKMAEDSCLNSLEHLTTAFCAPTCSSVPYNYTVSSTQLTHISLVIVIKTFLS